MVEAGDEAQALGDNYFNGSKAKTFGFQKKALSIRTSSSPLKNPYTPIRSHVIQKLLPPFHLISRNSYHTAHIPRRPCIKHPKRQQLVRPMRLTQC